MKLCINPWCNNRQNPDSASDCQCCQTPLLINERYFLLKDLRSTPHPYTEVYEVTDSQDKGKVKVLKLLVAQRPKLIELFHREQRILNELDHPGIPKGEHFFTLRLSNNQNLPCMVMEKIQGQDLEQWLKKNKSINQELALNWLKQITSILDFLHQRKLFHRDIKPANIMLKYDGQLVLIDFNAVRQITETVVEGGNVTAVHTKGYAAPEQIEGRAVPQSDFYALGRTFVHLLTGIYPGNIQPNITDWRSQTKHEISYPLAVLIDEMMAFSTHHRPPTAKVILQRIYEIEHNHEIPTLIETVTDDLKPPQKEEEREETTQKSPRKFWWLLNGTGVLIIVGVVGAIALPQFLTPKVCNSDMADYLSCGEESLVSESALEKIFENPRPIEKKQGIEEFKNKNYAQAEKLFQKAWEKQRDPETKIYQNNSLIHKLIQQGQISENKVKSIAVAAPLQDSPERQTTQIGLEMLRGVAQVQNQAINNDSNKIYLQVLIGDDSNEKKQGKKIADKIANKPDILAVVGHFASEITEVALPEYEKNKLVLISPTSTSTKETFNNKKYFFRTVPNNQAAGKALASYIDSQNNDKRIKVAVFGSPTSSFSESLSQVFSNNLGDINVLTPQECPEFDLSADNFNLSQALNKAKEKGAKAIVLIPDAGISSSALDNAIQVIKARNGFDFILGGDSLYRPNTPSKEAADKNLVLAIAWHYLNSDNSNRPASQDFLNSAQNLWGTKQATWRHATSYDATLVLIEALKQQTNSQEIKREGIRQALSKIKVSGATGDIQFKDSERMAAPITLVKVCNQGGKYIFVPQANQVNCQNIPPDK
jgi:ABC-type branched-subunit amino acid transport system substrate-binding protein